ncbi:MAG: HAD family hydrolase [Nitrospirae bacterium]|nr:HAD family hydrolase [Nitrospirota bacterium]
MNFPRTFPEGILFDLDGTLVDSFRPIHSSFQAVLDALSINRTLSWEEMLEIVGTSLRDSLRCIVPEEKADESVLLFREHYNRIVLDQTLPLPGAGDLLGKLGRQGIPTGIVTNKKGDAARRISDHLGFQSMMACIIGEGDGFSEKPAPDMIFEALRILGTSPGKTLFVGDSPYDFGAARAAGLPIALLPTGTHCEKDLTSLNPDLFFSDLKHFSQWLDQNSQGIPPAGT